MHEDRYLHPRFTLIEKKKVKTKKLMENFVEAKFLDKIKGKYCFWFPVLDCSRARGDTFN